MYFFEERIKRILDELNEYTHRERLQIDKCEIINGSYKYEELSSANNVLWSDFKSSDRWGGKDQHYWFKLEFEIPEKFSEKTIVFEVKTGNEKDWDATNPQFLIYINGRLIQGLDVNHREIILSEKALAGETYSILLYAYSGMKNSQSELNLSVAIFEKETEKLYYNVKVPYEIAKLMEKEDKRKIDIISYLNETINHLDLRKPFSKDYFLSVTKANEFIENEFYKNYCGRTDAKAICVGHTHIDVAWLWTLAQTREKAVRSFSTVLSLMEQYPEYKFMSSQPQLYKFVKEDNPQVYEEIKKKIADGRWEAEGAMWLEADCNLSSGESLIRQILYGTRFFDEEFGVKNKVLWLPDVFGYSAAMPQILRKSGIEYFMTTKISWNEYNKMPYDTFMWKGIDGTEILTHFITSSDYPECKKVHFTTYNSSLTPSQVMGAWERYQQKGLNDEVLISFGYGDGGGGPTKEMLENARRMAKGIPGCPEVEIKHSLDFFEKLNKRVSSNKKLPKWVGELYLEYHRGTYTSMARNKKYNRKSEFLYMDAEFFSAIGSNLFNLFEYPKEKLSKGWETILLNQFHDILPGSSIKEVYEDSLKQYEEVIDSGNSLVQDALNSVCMNMNLEETSIIVFNQLSFTRSDIVTFEIPDKYVDIEIYDNNNLVTSQIFEEKCKKKVIFFAEGIPAKGYKSFKLKTDSKSAVKKNREATSFDTVRKLSNQFFDVKFDNQYNITSIYDRKNMREVVKNGERANVLQAFEDKPHNFDAWDVNIYYQEKMWEISEVESAELVEGGPVRSTLKINRKFLDSTITQEIRIYNSMPRIDFVNTIDWKEKQILLKAAFPVDIHTDKATYEIQYGNVERPTHWNTSWDYARFEVCAHKWADLSEDNYGVSLMNDCKYGYDIKDGVMRLSLLKSATSPNEDADREVHEFSYSLYPHKGDWKSAGTVQSAYALNNPMYTHIEEKHAGSLPGEFSFVKCDSENVIIEAIKITEGSSEFIIRLYECHNRRTNVELNFFSDIAEIYECDMLENNIEKIKANGRKVNFEIKPYEIKTIKVAL